MGRITFQKRQKEMKRLEKQRAKAERRAQKKLARNTTNSAEKEKTVNQSNESLPTNKEHGLIDEIIPQRPLGTTTSQIQN